MAAPATGTTGEGDVLGRAASVVTAWFRARGQFDWDRAAEVATGPAAAFATHLSVAHLVAGRTAPLPETPTVAVDFTGLERDGTEVAVEGRVTVRWSDGGGEQFSGFRFADAGGDLLLADYANAAGPLSAHLVDGDDVPAARPAGPDTDAGDDVAVALVAAVWMAPEPVVALTVRIDNGTDGPVGLDQDGVTFASAGGPAVAPAYRHAVEAPPGGTGWVLAELRGDPLPTAGGELRVALADVGDQPIGIATVDVPGFAAG